ncbi:hypothetical protein CRYUN_Cryun08bG0166700 [Craigia yunnanensis]
MLFTLQFPLPLIITTLSPQSKPFRYVPYHHILKKLPSHVPKSHSAPPRKTHSTSKVKKKKKKKKKPLVGDSKTKRFPWNYGKKHCRDTWR